MMCLMDAADSGKVSWMLAFSGGPSYVPREFHSLAEEWHNIANREAAVGILGHQKHALALDAFNFAGGKIE